MASLRASVRTNNVLLHVTPAGPPTSSLVPETPAGGQTAVTETDRVQEAAVPPGTDQGTGRGDGSPSFSHGDLEPPATERLSEGPITPLAGVAARPLAVPVSSVLGLCQAARNDYSRGLGLEVGKAAD